ncbi:hypothetical protein KAT92_03065, partial [Candidatus Babeliales bacterium]|nr:hypothetical protein [Candidatus Babeliales bacterium]
MKRIVHGLLAALVIVGSATATTHTNKSFFAPRPHNPNLAMEQTTWHKQTALIDDDKFCGTIQATGFYDNSQNEKDLGQFFGVTNTRNSNSIDDFIDVASFLAYGAGGNPAKVHLITEDLFHNHNYTTQKSKLADKIMLRPDHESYGLRLDYHQKLDNFIKGLFFKVTMPIVHAKTSLGYSSTAATPNKQLLAKGGTLSGASKSLTDFLTGNVANTDAHDKQGALTKMKWHNSNSETGIADIDVTLGYNFLYKNDRHANVNIGLTIPTGNDPDGNFLWEAVVGNGGHWALGAGVDAGFQIWKDEDKSLDILFAANYRYLFESDEKRCPDFTPTTTSGNTHKMFSRYILGGKLNQAGGTALVPLANLITRDFDVTPGSQFDGMIDLAFNWGNWTFDLGYNLFAKEQEDIDWTGAEINNIYAVSSWGYDTANKFDTVAPINNAIAIPKTAYDLGSITHPSVLTHKIFGGVGHAFNSWEYPLMLGVGGSWEF